MDGDLMYRINNIEVHIRLDTKSHRWKIYFDNDFEFEVTIAKGNAIIDFIQKLENKTNERAGIRN